MRVRALDARPIACALTSATDRRSGSHREAAEDGGSRVCKRPGNATRHDGPHNEPVTLKVQRCPQVWAVQVHSARPVAQSPPEERNRLAAWPRKLSAAHRLTFPFVLTDMI